MKLTTTILFLFFALLGSAQSITQYSAQKDTAGVYFIASTTQVKTVQGVCAFQNTVQHKTNQDATKGIMDEIEQKQRELTELQQILKSLLNEKK